MALPSVVCTACGVRSSPDRAFCTGCGQPFAAASRQLAPAIQTQFAVPDYLMQGAPLERRSRATVIEEPPGPGLVIAGGIAVASALMFSTIGYFGGGVIAIGAALMIAGLWRQRSDRRSLERAGWWAALAGTIAVGIVVAQAEWLVAPTLPAQPLANPETTAEMPISAGIASSGFDVPMERGNGARTGWSPGPEPEGRVIARWRVYTGGEVYASPVLARGMVLLPTRTGALLALDAASGRERWRADLGGYVARSAAAVNGSSAFVASGYSLVAVSLVDGSEQWRAPIRFAGPSSPLVDRERVYLATQEGSVYAFDATTGKQEWARHNDGLVFGAAALSDGRIYVGNERGQIFAFDTEDGRERWRRGISGEIHGGLAVSGGTVFVPTREPSLVALSTRNGEEQWRAPLGGDAAPAVRNGRVFVAPGEGGLAVLDAGSGAVLLVAAGNGEAPGSPSLAGEGIYLAMGRSVVAVDAATGEAQWQFPTGGAVTGSPVIAGGMVYVASADGYLYGLGGTFGAGQPLEETGPLE
jgi:outer membrane protein assembly factor BamB